MRYVLIKPKARVLNDLWGHNSFCYNVRLTRSVVTYDVASAKTGIEDDNKEPNLADVVVATTRQRQDLQAARTKDITKDHNIPSMIGFRNVSFMLHTNVMSQQHWLQDVQSARQKLQGSTWSEMAFLESEPNV